MIHYIHYVLHIPGMYSAGVLPGTWCTSWRVGIFLLSGNAEVHGTVWIGFMACTNEVRTGI